MNLLDKPAGPGAPQGIGQRVTMGLSGIFGQ